MTATTTTTTRSARRGRATLGWIALVAAVVAVALVGVSVAFGGWNDRGAFDPESAGPDGTRAVVQILEEQGVTVTVARDRGAAERALASGPATLVMRDAPMLSDASVRSLADRARDVVLVEPRSRALDVLMRGSAVGGFVDEVAVDPGCELPAAVVAGGVRAGELYVPGDDVSGCYPVDGEYALLVAASDDGGTVTALDGYAALTNVVLPSEGNAALALGVLGRNADLVWYVPSLSDADSAEAPTIGDLTPPWVTPAIVLLLLSALVAAVWRGRRFGPLVAERLPVTVRANETTEGRARLYAASRDAAHAIAELRRATLARLARSLGLARRVDPDRVVDAVAQRLGADRAVVRDILIDFSPRTDRELVQASDRLRDLEASVRATLRTERTPR